MAVDLLEARQRLVDGDDVGEGRSERRRLAVELDALLLAAVLDAAIVAGALDEDAPHGNGRGGEEVAAPVPASVAAVAGKAQVGLVDERGGLQRQAGWLPCDARTGQSAQLVVDLRQKLG